MNLWKKIRRNYIKKIWFVSNFAYNRSSKIKRELIDCQSILDVCCGEGGTHFFTRLVDLQ